MNLMRYKIMNGKLYFWSEMYDKWLKVPNKKKSEAKENASEEDHSKNYDRAMKGV